MKSFNQLTIFNQLTLGQYILDTNYLNTKHNVGIYIAEKLYSQYINIY